jgi:DNA-directed RNA polymerase subunit RPC12/RpoP
MSLNKAINSNKEHRKPYKGAKSVDKECRNHGDCPYCESNRLFKSKLGKGKKA